MCSKNVIHSSYQVTTVERNQYLRYSLLKGNSQLDLLFWTLKYFVFFWIRDAGTTFDVKKKKTPGPEYSFGLGFCKCAVKMYFSHSTKWYRQCEIRAKDTECWNGSPSRWTLNNLALIRIRGAEIAFEVYRTTSSEYPPSFGLSKNVFHSYYKVAKVERN